MNKTDLVYILGSGSQWNNNELRLSLRSVHQNLKGVGRIFVVGEDPGFLSPKVTRIYHPDEIGPHNADGNMALKILRACREKSLSDNFLFMNDDFIINKPVVAANIPWMHKGDMKDRPPGFWVTQPYRFRLRRTFDTLAMRGLPTMQYDYHAPMLMNKHKFPEVMQQYDFHSDVGLTFRSLYGNTLGLPADNIAGRKVTIYKHYTLAQITERVKDAMFIGYNDLGLNSAFKFYLFSRFNEKSPFEATPVSGDKAEAVARWVASGHDYAIGVKVFEEFYQKRNVSRIFSKYRSDVLDAKLKFKLNRYICEL
ncbi:MAG: hypothetical protein AB7C90_02500 [Bacteroidales bacterium]